MSKSNGNTKIATLLAWAVMEDEGDGFLFLADSPLQAGCLVVGVSTSCGDAGWRNSFTEAFPGDRVVLRRGRAASGVYGRGGWVMTGLA